MRQDAKERVIFYSNKISANNALIEKYKAQVEMLDECIKKLNTGIKDIEDAFLTQAFYFIIIILMKHHGMDTIKRILKTGL